MSTAQAQDQSHHPTPPLPDPPEAPSASAPAPAPAVSASASASASAPPSTPARTTVMDCTSDASKFTNVQIHTAKCAKCDLRNRDLMRRCPGCTYQVCQPCFNAQRGAPLIHGNLGSSPVGLPSTPARRRLFGPGPGLGTPGSVGSSASVGTVRVGVGRAGFGAGAGAGGGAGAGAESSGLPERAAGTVMPTANAITATANAGADAQMPHTPASRKRARKAKKRAPIIEDSTTTDEDDDDFDDLGSPTPTSKRRKSVAATPAGEKMMDSSAPSRRSARQPVRNTAVASPTATRPGPSIATDKEDIMSRVDAELPDVSSESEGADEEANILDREVGDNTIQKLLEAEGIDTPGNRYKEHLLHRQQPVIQDPVIAIPPHVRRNFVPRPNAEQIQKNFQAKGEEALEELRAKDQAKQAAGSISGPIISVKTLRDFVRAKTTELQQGIELTADQRNYLMTSMERIISKMLTKLNRALSPAAAKHVQYDLDYKIEHFVQLQDQMAEAIRKNGTALLDEYREEERQSTGPSTPLKQAMTNSFPTPRSGSTLPPVGMFQVSPSKAQVAQGVGSAVAVEGTYVSRPDRAASTQPMAFQGAVSNEGPRGFSHST